MPLEVRELLLEPPVDRHVARTRAATRPRRRRSASRPRRPPRARAGDRPARGSCSSRAAAPGRPSSSTRGPCGPETTRMRRYRPRSRRSSSCSSMSLTRALGSTWTSAAAPRWAARSGPAPRLAAPSGRGGTERFGRWRSCVGGIPEVGLGLAVHQLVDRRLRASRPRASRSGCPAAGSRRCPAGAPRSGPSSSNIARSHSGSEPSVVRKLPIITPFSPALTASCWSSSVPRFSLRPPQSRNSASGMTAGRSRPTSRPPAGPSARGRRTWCPGAGSAG